MLFTIWPTSTEDRRLAVLDLKSGQQKTLVPRGFAGQYLETGHLIYAMAGSQGSGGQVFATLWVVGFDLDRLEKRGEAVRVGEGLQVDTPAVNYAVSNTGALAYIPARERLRSFVWVDRMTGRETVIDSLPPRSYDTFGLSPDGGRMAFAFTDRDFEISTYDFAQQSTTRLTFDRSFEFLPRWTHDSQRIVFQSDRHGPLNLYSVASDGSGQVERLSDSSSQQYPNSITRDGALLFAELQAKGGFDIFRLPPSALAGAGRAALANDRRSEPTPLLSTSASEYAANISPDGRYFAYQSVASDGRFAVYVRAYPDASKGPWRISPRWRRGTFVGAFGK